MRNWLLTRLAMNKRNARFGSSSPVKAFKGMAGANERSIVSM